MTHTSSSLPFGRLISLAYAGTDMPVHIVCESDSGALTPRSSIGLPSAVSSANGQGAPAVALLEAFRQCRPEDPATGLRR